MDKRFSDFKHQARDLAAEIGRPRFERDYALRLSCARDMFFEHPMVLRLQEDLLPFLYDDYGHGVEHAKRVALDTATIVLAEAEVLGLDMGMARRLALLGELSGLLHDVCRVETDHPRRGAELARMILAEYELSNAEVEAIALSVKVHEEFRPAPELRPELLPDQRQGDVRHEDSSTVLLAAALHDADIFRWGPDFFVTTLWEICDYEDWSNEEILSRFEPAMEHIRSLGATLRTSVGRTYGPEILDIGLRLAPRILVQARRALGQAEPLSQPQCPARCAVRT